MKIKTLVRGIALVAPIALLTFAPALAMMDPTPGPGPIDQRILVLIVGVLLLIP